MTENCRLLIGVLLLALGHPLQGAELSLSNVFSDHAVLQRDVAVPIWGSGTPGEEISVDFADQQRTTKADSEGRWMVKLLPMKASSQSRDLVVRSQDGKHSVKITDILVGEVWLCAGQSNMEMGIGACNVTGEIAAANLPDLRLMTVPRAIAATPQRECVTSAIWKVCSPKSVIEGGWGGFSAAAFFFGRQIQRDLKVPVGLINMSWGGTAAESWTSLEALQSLPAIRPAIERNDQESAAHAANAAKDGKERENWLNQHDPGSSNGVAWAKPSFDDSAWASVQLPNEYSSLPIGKFVGFVWFRRTFELPPDWHDKELLLNLGPIDDFDATFVNGVSVGETYQRYLDRTYRIPGRLLHPGKNTIAVRVLNTFGFGGLYGEPEQLRLTPSEGHDTPLSLAGEWRWKAGSDIANLKPIPNVLSQDPPLISSLFNGIVSPVIPYAARGAIWYQGESNTSRTTEYRQLLTTLIADWRRRWGMGDFPFYIVQLANHTPAKDQPTESKWAEIREAQRLTAQELPSCGLAVTIDVGEAADIHPKNKREVGRRLALVALEKTYGHPLECSGPMYRSMKVEGNVARLTFTHAAGGLIAKGGSLKQFAIAGDDGKYSWADARIDGDNILVSSASVPKPVSVRYAWADNPEGCNLYNKADLPASPFRTEGEPIPSPTATPASALK